MTRRKTDRGRLGALAWAAAFAIVAAACAGGSSRSAPRAGFPESSGNDEVMRDDVPAQSGRAFTVDLSAEAQMVLGEPSSAVHVAITNNSSEEVTAAEMAPELRVDGLPAMELDLVARGFETIAPGETVEFDQNLGVRLLSPGDHELQLDIGESHSLPVHILVVGE